MTRRGYSLAELVVTLGLTAALLGTALPRAAGWRDGFAVRAARNELVAGLAWTRMAAVGAGGASFVIEPDSGLFRTLTAAGAAGPARDLRSRYGVTIESPGATAEIPFDALGIGRLASRTVVVTRGAARAGVVVSAYGRVRTW